MKRLQLIEEIFQEALQRNAAERDAYVREACHGDIELQREVASLLANHHEETHFKPWAAVAAAAMIVDRPSLQPGQCLGPYRIECFLVAGGMGEVYRATDTRLNRPVAIKVSAERFTERFEREARVIASLNHPNICTLYDVGPNYLVMEYVEGRTLAERIHQGPVPLAEALEMVRQMAAALEEAHQRLVVHRDFKPGNVKIKPDGTVKVLDFGLAKLNAVSPTTSANASDSPTLTISDTQAGVLLGTAAYMSPEQARGEPVDKRGDVWAFGVVLWEMLTGKRLFQGKTTSDVLAAVIRDEPDLSRAPAKVRPLLKRCLEKDPRQRLRDIGDAVGIIESTPEARPAPSRLVWTLAATAAVFGVISAALALVHFRETPPEARVLVTSINPPENASFAFRAGDNAPALSPDGRQIAFSARGADGKIQLWVRPLDSPVAQPLAGTEGAGSAFWSPDSRSVAFFANRKLRRMDVTGGSALTLADASGFVMGSWSPQDIIVFAGGGGALQRVVASGGVPIAATTLAPGHFAHLFPWFLPDGQHFIFLDQTQPGSSDAMLRIGALDSKEVKTIGPATSNVVYSNGYLLYVRERTLMAQPFDEKRLATAGEAVPVAEQIRTFFGGLGPIRTGTFSISHQGLLAYQAGEVEDQQLTWFDRGGKPAGTVGDAGDVWSLEFSPDRKSVAVSLLGDNQGIWIYDVTLGRRTRFTFGPAAHRDAVWSPDGRSIAYMSNAKGQFDLYRKAADGTGNEELLYADEQAKIPTSWSPDGKFLLYQVRRGALVLPLTGPSGPSAPLKLFPWLAAPYYSASAKFSPDGHWVVYTGSESGGPEIYVAPFPGPGGRRQISNGGGFIPRWRADGKEIFYSGLNRTLMAAEVLIKGATVEPGAVHALGIPVAPLFYRYDVSADGQRFLVATPREQNSVAPLTLVQNWTALLKKMRH